MERTTDELKAQGRPSNHPLIDANLGPLQRDITLAREGVQKNPPNYFLVGSLTCACIYCTAEAGERKKDLCISLSRKDTGVQEPKTCKRRHLPPAGSSTQRTSAIKLF